MDSRQNENKRTILREQGYSYLYTYNETVEVWRGTMSSKHRYLDLATSTVTEKPPNTNNPKR